MNLAKVRKALAKTIATNMNVSTSWFVSDNPTAPQIIVLPDPGDDACTFEHNVHLRMVLKCLAKGKTAEEAQMLLDGWLSVDDGTRSNVADVIEADSTLGGIVQSATVTGWRNYGVTLLPDGGVRYWSADVLVDIYA